MSDRLAVMEAGKVAQVGTPVDVYEEPADAYVADFLGVSNLMDAQADGAQRRRGLPDPPGGLRPAPPSRGDRLHGGPVKVAIRPERVRIERLRVSRVPTGYRPWSSGWSSSAPPPRCILRLAHGDQVQALMQNQGGLPLYQQGTAVQAHLPADALRVLRSALARPRRGRRPEVTPVATAGVTAPS